MTRTKLLTLLSSAAVGMTLAAYGLSATAEDKAKTAETPVAEDAAKPAPIKGDYVLVKYDNKEIRKSEFDMLWDATFPDGTAPKYDSFTDGEKVELLKNLVRERVILDEAYANNVDKTDMVKKLLENNKRQIIAQAYLKGIGDKLVTDKQVRQQYDLLVEKNKGKKEVHARHILVEKEDEAKDIAKQLKEGADFDAIAAKKSIDKGTGARGGDLGYFTRDAMVPEFAEVAFKLDKGKVSDPVKTEFGWHIIKVEDKRDLKAPAFDEVKEDLKKSIMNKALGDYLKGLLDGKKVTFYDASGKELKPEAPKKDAAAAAAAAEAPAPAKEKKDQAKSSDEKKEEPAKSEAPAKSDEPAKADDAKAEEKKAE